MNKNNNIESELRQFIAKNLLFSDEGYPLSDDASFLSKGVVDSTGVMELIEHVSQQFGLEVPLADITPGNFDSIANLAGYVRRRMAQSPAGSPDGLGTKPAPSEV